MTQVFEFDGSTFSSTYELQGFEQNLCCDDDPHLAAAVGTGWVSHVHEQGKEAAAEGPSGLRGWIPERNRMRGEHVSGYTWDECEDEMEVP